MNEEENLHSSSQELSAPWTLLAAITRYPHMSGMRIGFWTPQLLTTASWIPLCSPPSLPPSLLSNAPCCLSFSRLCLNCSAPSLLSLPRFAAPSLFSSSSSSSSSTLRPSCPPLILVYRRSEAPSAGSRPTDWLILSHLSLWMTHYCLHMIYSPHTQRSTVILTSSGVDEKLREQREH